MDQCILSNFCHIISKNYHLLKITKYHMKNILYQMVLCIKYMFNHNLYKFIVDYYRIGQTVNKLQHTKLHQENLDLNTLNSHYWFLHCTKDKIPHKINMYYLNLRYKFLSLYHIIEGIFSCISMKALCMSYNLFIKDLSKSNNLGDSLYIHLWIFHLVRNNILLVYKEFLPY